MDRIISILGHAAVDVVVVLVRMRKGGKIKMKQVVFIIGSIVLDVAMQVIKKKLGI